MTMNFYDKHLNMFKQVYKNLSTNLDDDHARLIITNFMFYLEKNHLVDKHYLEHNELFLACEVNQDKIKHVSVEVLLSFLTMIYRIDYIDPNSDAYMIYYKNKMLGKIIHAFIEKFRELKGV